MGQDAVLTIAVVLGSITTVAAVIALFVTLRTQSLLRASAPTPLVDPTRDPRRAFANLLRRYSELLGVEVVTGRIPHRGDTSVGLRVQLETELGRLRVPGAVELLDEVGDARDGLVDLEPRRRAAANGLVAMQVEWSIERWAANPRAWLADCRELDRLTRIVTAEPAPRAEPRPAGRLAAAS